MIDSLDGAPHTWPPRLREAFEERAAIMQWHGGMSKRTAEERAAWWIRFQLRASRHDAEVAGSRANDSTRHWAHVT